MRAWRRSTSDTPTCRRRFLAGAGEIRAAFQIARARRCKRRNPGWTRPPTRSKKSSTMPCTRGTDKSLEQIVGYWLQMRNATLAVAESCTGGLLGERITSVGGSSRYFAGGAIVYANAVKTELAGVPGRDDGAPWGGEPGSSGGAGRRASAIVARRPWEWASPVWPGPGGGTSEKPVGLGFPRIGERLAGLK
jgi:hypothetical protein